MPNSNTDPVELIKRAAVAAVEAAKPVNVVFGTVLTASPLTITLEQKMTLREKQLILSRNVTNFALPITVDDVTEEHTHTHAIADTYSGGGSASQVTHCHQYAGTKSLLVRNKLNVGEKVILLRMQGGQKFLVLDRLGAGT